MLHHIPPESVYGWSAAALAAASLSLWVRQSRVTAAWRLRAEDAEDAMQARDRELDHFVAVRLPKALRVTDEPSTAVPDAREAMLQDTPFAELLDVALSVAAAAVGEANAGSEEAAQAAVSAAMRAVGSLANEQQALISAMQDQHDDPVVLEGLLGLDHANSQLGRRTQGFAVLCGVWPLQQRSAASLEDVLRGAMSRIRDYHRVQVFPGGDAQVAARVVEPVVLALAELLDNAARYSSPDTHVEVRVIKVHHGVLIQVDDYGVGMPPEAETVAGQLPVTMSSLGDPPRVGFALLRVLSARYGFGVEHTTSPYGGVRAIVSVPDALLTAARPPDAHSAALSLGAAPAQTAAGLPQRRRQTRRPPAPSAPPAASPRAQQDVQASAAGLGAFQHGTNLGRAHHPQISLSSEGMTPQ